MHNLSLTESRPVCVLTHPTPTPLPSGSNFGKLCKAQGKSEKAIKHFAEDVYYSSLEVGPEHPDTARGYFHMATIFYMQRQVEHALAFFDKVVDCWYKYLLGTGDDGMGMSEAQLQEVRHSFILAAAAARQHCIASLPTPTHRHEACFSL